MNAFDLVSELKIGHIVEVSGTTIRVELSGDVTELTRTYDGRVYPIGQIGSIVKIHFGRRLVFGFVTLLRMRSEELLEVAKPIPPDADQRVMEVELFAEGIWNAAEGKLTVRSWRYYLSASPPRRFPAYATRDGKSLQRSRGPTGKRRIRPISSFCPLRWSGQCALPS